MARAILLLGLVGGLMGLLSTTVTFGRAWLSATGSGPRPTAAGPTLVTALGLTAEGPETALALTALGLLFSCLGLVGAWLGSRAHRTGALLLTVAGGGLLVTGSVVTCLVAGLPLLVAAALAYRLSRQRRRAAPAPDVTAPA
jgi:hypothetical protein